MIENNEQSNEQLNQTIISYTRTQPTSMLARGQAWSRLGSGRLNTSERSVALDDLVVWKLTLEPS